MGPRRRVVLVGRGAPERGGIATFLATLAASPLAERHDVETVNLAPPERHVGGRLDRANLVRTWTDLGRVHRAARHADIAHLHSALAPAPTLVRAGALALAARTAGAPVVVHAHGGLLPTWMRGRVRRLLVRGALAPVARVIAVSERGRAALADVVGPERVALVPNGIDTVRFAPSDRAGRPGDRPAILYVGVLSERKGVLDLLAASDRLLERGVAHDVWLAGGVGDEGPGPVERIRAAAGAHVRLLGTLSLEEMPAVYASADVFCLPSWWEAMPLSVLEAMASGLPVVVTGVGDVPDVVDETCGRVVAPQDPEALARALGEVLADPLQAAGMGRAGRARAVDRYGTERTVRGVEQVYDDVLGRLRPTGRRARWTARLSR